MELFEETLKSTLVHISFNKSAKYRTNWYRQVKEIDCYWDQMISDIQEEDVLDILLGLPQKETRLRSVGLETANAKSHN